MTFQFHTTPVTEDEQAVFPPQLAMALDTRLECTADGPCRACGLPQTG